MVCVLKNCYVFGLYMSSDFLHVVLRPIVKFIIIFQSLISHYCCYYCIELIMRDLNLLLPVPANLLIP